MPATSTPAPEKHYRGPFGFLGNMSTRSAVATIFVVAMFIDIMDGTIVNTALPAIGKEFHHDSPSQLSWVVLGYLLSLAIWIPASGWLGDKFGTKKIFLFALFMFTCASILCGSADSLLQLSIFRFIQGIGGGMMTPVGTAMLFREYPPAERAKASAILVVPTLIAPALGPVLGGYLTDQLSWRWIFFVNAPFGVAAFLFGIWRLKEYQHEAAGKFDPAGFVLSAGALGAVLYALTEAETVGWASPQVLVPLVVGLALGAALVVVEARVKDPILALRLFKESVFRSTNLTSVFSTASFFGLILLMPLMLQTVRGLTASQSGLTTFPQAVGVIVMSQIVRKLYPKIGPRRMLCFGLIAGGLVMLSLQFTTAASSLWIYRVVLFGRGMCWAFVFIPLQAAAFAKISPVDTGRASALFSTQRQFSSSLGIAVLISILAAQITKTKATVRDLVEHGHVLTHAETVSHFYDAYKVPFFWCSMFAFIGAISALWVDDTSVLAVLRGGGQPRPGGSGGPGSSTTPSPTTQGRSGDVTP